MLNSNKYIRLSKENVIKHQGRHSSFWMHDPEVIFSELKLHEGETFLDVGCGAGEYTTNAAKRIGKMGQVYAIDRNKTLIEKLKEKSKIQNLTNIQAISTDITRPFPLDDRCVDVCLVATVLHALGSNEDRRNVFHEISRVLKPSGRLITIDCSKKDGSFGPPMDMRLSPNEIEALAVEFGFRRFKLVDLGFNYLIQFDVKKGSRNVCQNGMADQEID